MKIKREQKSYGNNFLFNEDLRMISDSSRKL